MSQSDNASLSRTALRRKIKVLVSSDRDDRELLEVLEGLVRNQYFAGLAHLWAPTLYRRDKALFRPFLERYLWGWQLDSTKCKEWIEQLELNGEVKLFRQVYIATLPDTDWEMREQVWASDLLEAMKRADSPQRQRDVLRMYQMWWQIPEEVAIELYELAPSATIEYICERLDRLGEWDEPPSYELLLARLESAGDEGYWDLYGRCVSAEQWQADVLAQCAEVDDPDELDDELERRHPSTRMVPEPAETFCALVEARGDVSFRIPKSSGGSRLIMAPKRELRALQRSLLEQLVEKLPISEYAHGFRKGRSVATNAAPHVGKEIVIGMDLRDFFGSVTFARVRGYLIAMGYGYPVATSLALLITEAPRQRVELDGQVHHTPIGRRYCVQGPPPARRCATRWPLGSTGDWPVWPEATGGATPATPTT